VRLGLGGKISFKKKKKLCSKKKRRFEQKRFSFFPSVVQRAQGQGLLSFPFSRPLLCGLRGELFLFSCFPERGYGGASPPDVFDFSSTRCEILGPATLVQVAGVEKYLE